MTVRIAIIGCGAIAETHADCLSQIEGAELTTFCDIDRKRAEQLKTRYGGKIATDSPEQVFRDGTIDAVYICTHHDSHSALAVRAAQAGKHVLIEKPLALTREECARIGEAVERSGIILMTAFKLRYYPSVARARQFMPSPHIVIAQITDSRWPDDFWANDPVKGGGNVLSQGGHAMDLICHLVGREPVSIYAAGGNFTHPKLEIVDNIAATILFEDGAMASVVIGDSGATPFLSKFSFQMFDGVRTAHLHNRLRTVTLFDGNCSETYEERTEQGFIEENRIFIRCVQKGTQPDATYRDGMRSTLLLLGAMEAVRTGQPQPITF